MIYGVPNAGRRPSRFLAEIGSDRLQLIEYSGDSFDDAPVGMVNRRKQDTPKEDAQRTETLKTGDAIRHARFGRGVVLYTKGTGARVKARIRFDSGRVAMISLDAAPIEKIQR